MNSSVFQGFPDPGSPATELPLIDNMKAQGILKRNLFGLYMSSDIDQPGKEVTKNEK